MDDLKKEKHLYSNIDPLYLKVCSEERIEDYKFLEMITETFDYKDLAPTLKKNGKFCLYKMNHPKLTDEYKIVPFNPITENLANVNLPETFADFDETYDMYSYFREGEYHGIGLLIEPGLSYISVKRANENGRFTPLALQLIKLFKGSYIEFSIGGNSLHIFCKVSEELRGYDQGYYRVHPNSPLESYPGGSGHYICLSGKSLHKIAGTHFDITDQTENYKIFLEKYMKRDFEFKQSDLDEIQTSSYLKDLQRISDEKLIEIALRGKNGEIFNNLFFRGDTYGFKSRSEADLRLAGMLCFYCGNDLGRVKRLMLSSSICRDKYIERENYLDRTIKCAAKNTFKTYNPFYRKH